MESETLLSAEPKRARAAQKLSWTQVLCYSAPSFALTCVYGSPYHVFVNKYYLRGARPRPNVCN